MHQNSGTDEATALRKRLTQGADRCVKCAMCQPGCPSYALTRNESDSPRGRVTLIALLAAERITPTKALDRHLDGCLLCRRCETLCPSGVPFGDLIDQARRLTLSKRPAWLRLTTELLSRPAAAGTLISLGRLAPKRLNSMATMAHLADRAPVPGAGVYPAVGIRRARLGLFLGCVARHTHSAVLQTSLKLLNQLGFEVVIPRSQGCCGALHAHLGDAQRAARLASANRAAFAADLDAIVSVATGCGAHLQDSHAYQDTDLEHQDINSVLAKAELERFDWKPLVGRALVHTPCSQVNVLRNAGVVAGLLQHIPQLDVAPLPDNNRCCGAAGSFLLTHPEESTRLRANKLEALETQSADWLVTSNPGCALHFASARSKVPKVVHPVQLLWRQLAGDAASR